MSFTVTGISLKTPARAKWTPAGNAYDDEVWNVRFTGDWEPNTCLNSPYSGLPLRRSSPSWDLTVYVSAIRLEWDEDMRIDAANPGSTARYVVSYSPITFKSILECTPPLSRPVQWTGSGSDETRSSVWDVNGTLMVNSAWQVYSGLPPIPIAGADVVATFNVASNPISMATLLSKTTNNATWNGVARTNGRIGKISYRYVVEEFDSETVEYYQVTMPISFRPDSWKWLPIDSGTDILVATTSSGQPVWKAVLDQYGNRVTTPVLLNGSGAQGTVGFTGVVYPASGYEQYTESDWTAGGVPNPF